MSERDGSPWKWDEDDFQPYAVPEHSPLNRPRTDARRTEVTVLPETEETVEWPLDEVRESIIRAFDVPPWMIVRNPRPKFARLRWRLRRIWPLKSAYYQDLGKRPRRP